MKIVVVVVIVKIVGIARGWSIYRYICILHKMFCGICGGFFIETYWYIIVYN